MDLAACAAAKAEANAAFGAGRFAEADAQYTRALAFLADVPVPGTGAAAVARAAAALALREAEGGSSVDAVAVANGHANGNGTAEEMEEDEGDDGADDGGSVVSELSIASGASDGSVYPGPAAEDDTAAANGVALGADRREVSEEARAKAVLLANRSMARLRLEQYGFAINDANDALALDPSYAKSLYRRGAAYFALGNVTAARRDFREIVRRLPRDADARTKLAECEKVLREERFARALDIGGYDSDGSVGSSGSGVSACDSVDLDSLVVEEGYVGPAPATERGEIDAEFIARLMECFRGQGKLHYKYAVQIMLQAKKLFEAMPNIVEVPVPAGSKITVCGDVHGQFYDLVDSIFEKNGMPSAENPYVFNGDFVDRGSFSVEVILLLLSLKVACPESIHLTRGNHESINMNKIYGFEGEVKHKYKRDLMFRMFTELFQSLPLGYILDGTVDGASGGKRAFIVHGGLFSKDGITIDDLQRLNRRREPDDGLMAEMLWSDPQDAPGWGPSKRGIGVAFGPDVTHRFLDANGLDIVIRSHEMKDEGYEVGADGRLVTIFSAPNYCDQMGNKGAYISFDCTMKPKFTQFSAVPHPNVRAMAYAGGMMGLM